MRLATLAFALGPAALALGFGLSGDPEPAADRPAATGVQAAAPARADGPPEFAATADLKRARERLDALDPGATSNARSPILAVRSLRRETRRRRWSGRSAPRIPTTSASSPP